MVSFQDIIIVHRDNNCKGQRARLKLGLHSIATNKNTAKLGTHRGTSPYDYSLQKSRGQVPPRELAIFAIKSRRSSNWFEFLGQVPTTCS